MNAGVAGCGHAMRFPVVSFSLMHSVSKNILSIYLQGIISFAHHSSSKSVNMNLKQCCEDLNEVHKQSCRS